MRGGGVSVLRAGGWVCVTPGLAGIFHNIVAAIFRDL